MRKFNCLVLSCIIFFVVLTLSVLGCKAQEGLAINLSADNEKQQQGTDNKTNNGGKLTITMFDVLHGDAILLQDGKQNIMIDVGHPSSQDILTGKLDRKGIKRINTVIVTHHHSDHMGNIFKIAGKYGVSRIYDNGLINENNAASVKLNDILRKGNYKNKVLRAGDNIKFGRDLWFEVLSPGDFLPPGLQRNINNSSIVMKMHYKDFTMMFTGDIENPVEYELSQRYGSLLKADVLKVAHHGSRSSSNFRFISQVKPQFALISCGDFSKYHHPNKNVVGALNHLGATVYYTNANGDIEIITDGENYTVKASR